VFNDLFHPLNLLESMKIASKNLARALVLGSVLAGGITLAQSFYNEAQATGSGGGGSRVYCFSQSEVASGRSYYDCGNCQRRENEKPLGNALTCP
jgi:mevalonate kinase